jgi:membrane protein insertase Oxa1/YidC/SpoIIIJ
MGIINFTKPITGNFLVDIILWLVNITSVAGGVVLFTLILKLITLPFDYVSRASMRKNSVKMEEMRPELEKLQKQYADNKDLYNQKMMALYKKNGYSMFGACLPTILTLVIFIVALNGFTAYSQYQNKAYFYNMSISYNNVIYSGIETDDEYIKREENGVIIINQQKLLGQASPVQVMNEQNELSHEIFYEYVKTGDELESGNVVGESYKLVVYTTNSFVKYVNTCVDYTDESRGVIWSTSPSYQVVSENLVTNNLLASAENNNLTILREDKKLSFSEVKDEEGMTADKFLLDIQQQKSAETYRKENSSFLWVKNIWVTDSASKHPVETNWQAFKTTHAYNGTNDYDIGELGYKNLIAKLQEEQTQPNGYFILVILTAGVSFLMQFVTSKTQKAQMELQTVDGQGAQTQKIMMWMMPIMMAVFAFMYTAAFSIYIILSSIISLLTTFAINFIVDRQLKKQKKNADNETVRGRVHVPKADEIKDQKDQNKTQKKKTDDKFYHEKGGDFLTGKADKHPRGRLK